MGWLFPHQCILVQHGQRNRRSSSTRRRQAAEGLAHQHFTMGGIEPIQKRDQRAGGREKYTGEATILPSAWRNISAARLTQSSITHLWSVRQAKHPRQPGTTSAPMCSSSDSAPPSVSPCPTSRSASAVLPFLWGLPLIITTLIKKPP